MKGVLFALPFFLYAPSLGFGLLGFDDSTYFLGNPALHGAPAGGLLEVWKAPFYSDYFPLTHWTLWLDLALFGDDSFWFARLHEIAWFGAGTLAVRALAERLTGNARLALAIALLYALHPLNALATLWLAERKQVLCVAAVFWCLERYIAAREADDPARARRIGCAAFALGLAALLTKAHGVVTPVVLFVYEAWRWLRLPREARRLAEPVRWIAPHVAATAAFLAVSLAWLRSDMDMALVGGDRLSALASTGLIVLRYLQHTFVPWGLSFFYSIAELPASSPWGWLSWLAVLAISASFVWLARGPAGDSEGTQRAWTAGLGMALGLAAMAPALNLMPQSLPMMDHYTQWALPGWLLGAALAVQGCLARLPEGARPKLAAGLAAAAALACAALAWLRMPVFETPLALFGDAARRQPDSALAWGNYAHHMLNRPDPEHQQQARAAGLRAFEGADAGRLTSPLRARLLVEAAVALHEAGKPGEAGELFERQAAQLGPTWARIVPTLRAEVALRSGDAQRAAEWLADTMDAAHMQAAQRLRAQCREGGKLPQQVAPELQFNAAGRDLHSLGFTAYWHGRALLLLAQARLAAGDLEGAWDAAAVLVNLGPAFGPGREALAEAWRKLGREDLAARALSEPGRDAHRLK